MQTKQKHFFLKLLLLAIVLVSERAWSADASDPNKTLTESSRATCALLLIHRPNGDLLSLMKEMLLSGMSSTGLRPYSDEGRVLVTAEDVVDFIEKSDDRARTYYEDVLLDSEKELRANAWQPGQPA